MQEACRLLRIQGAPNPSRLAHGQNAGGNLHTRVHQRTGTHNGAGSYHGAVHHDGTDPDEAAITHSAGMHHRGMPDGHVGADIRGITVRADVNDRLVLNIGTTSKPDRVHVATQHGPETVSYTHLTLPTIYSV